LKQNKKVFVRSAIMLFEGGSFGLEKGFVVMAIQ
jgi:hypothetical protein